MARSLTRPAERVQSTQTVGRSGSGVSTVTCSEIGPLARGPSATCGLDWRRWECRGFWVDVVQSCKAAKEKACLHMWRYLALALALGCPLPLPLRVAQRVRHGAEASKSKQ